MAKTFTRKAKHAIAGAAQRGAKNVKAVAGEALGAAARAATDIVLQRTAAALGSGRDQLMRSRPAVKRAAGRVVTNSVSKAGRRKAPAAPQTHACRAQDQATCPLVGRARGE